MAPELKPGDVIGFSGRGYQSVAINILTYGIPHWSISHVGILGQHKGKLLLFESTTLTDIPCVIQGKSVQGTQACHLEDRLKSYAGRAWHYPLYRKLFAFECKRLNDFLVDHIGVPYDREGAIRAGGSLWSWVKSFFYPENLDFIFCSEFCAAAHRDIGLLRTDNASSWNPNSFVRHERGVRILAKPWRLK